MEKYEYYSVGLPAVWLHQENQQGGLLFFDEKSKPQKTITVGFFTGISKGLTADERHGIWNIFWGFFC